MPLSHCRAGLKKSIGSLIVFVYPAVVVALKSNRIFPISTKSVQNGDTQSAGN